MKGTDYLGFCILLAGIIAGYAIGEFKGGALCGIFLMGFTMAAIGKYQELKIKSNESKKSV